MHFTWKMKARVLARDSSVLNLLMGMRARKQQGMGNRKADLGRPTLLSSACCWIMHKISYRYSGRDRNLPRGYDLCDEGHFKKIYSIELSKELHERAKSALGSTHIFILLPVIAQLQSRVSWVASMMRCLFWLDGHYSGGITALGDVQCPIRAEIEAILRHPIKDHVLLIDDAICFDGHHGYPTLFELHDIVVSRFTGYEMQVF